LDKPTTAAQPEAIPSLQELLAAAIAAGISRRKIEDLIRGPYALSPPACPESAAPMIPEKVVELRCLACGPNDAASESPPTAGE
jgi:hypothetical protein